MSKVLYAFAAFVFFSTYVSAISIDTVLIKPYTESQIITSNCFHSTGNYFKPFASSSNEWNDVAVPNYRLTPDKTHWIYFVLKNESSTDLALKLFLNNVQAGVTRMYVVTDGQIDSSQLTGSLLSANQRSSLDRMLSFITIIKSGKTVEVYLQTFRKEIGITLTMVITNPVLNSGLMMSDYILVIVLAITFFIVFISIIVLGYFPSKESFWFFIYVLSGFFYVMAASGFGSLYLWSGVGWFEENASIFTGAVSTVGFFEFSRSVLKTKYSNPFINALLIAFSVIYFSSGLLGFGVSFNLFTPGFYTSFMQLPYLFMLICFVVVFCLCAYKAIYKNEKELWWFVATFSFYIFMSIVIVLLEIGVVTYKYKMHAFLIAFGALPQMLLTLFFLIKRTVVLLKQRERAIVDLQLLGAQELLNERLRISRELHDDMGSTLSSISVYSEVAKNRAAKNENETEVLQKIGTASRELIEKMSDIVWSLNPNNENFEQLKNRMMAFAAMMLAPKGILFEFDIDDEVKSTLIAPEQRKNIFLIYKEAINNIVKYSEATSVKVRVKVKENKLSLEVIDNGKGFDTNNIVAYNGNGLKNMRARAEEIKGLFNITSRINEGTGVELSFNL